MIKKKYPEIVTETTLLTPEKAQTLLDGQFEGVMQRKQSTRYVQRYADAIKRNLWLFDAMPIRIDWYGRMFDGQHRCKAIVMAGKSVKVLIVYGLDPEVYKVCDRGKPRAFKDALRSNNEKYYCELASALVMLYTHDRGLLLTGARQCMKTLQTQDVLELLDVNPNLRKSADKARLAKMILPASIGCFLHYVLSRKNAGQADEFFEKLANGEGFKKKDPIRLLRDRLVFNKTEAIKMERVYKIAIAIKAWNTFRCGETMTKLTWRGPKKPKESMPTIN